jgi:hypothetical protein
LEKDVPAGEEFAVLFSVTVPAAALECGIGFWVNQGTHCQQLTTEMLPFMCVRND